MAKKHITRSVRGMGMPLGRETFFQTFIARKLNKRQALDAWNMLSCAVTDIEFYRLALSLMQEIEPRTDRRIK